ncbi:MAG: hypothetical protein QF732_11890, partial [Nitrospinaceae bacterium]|nr:hypothetical protein [Nitrospinaceae bacterium]
FARRDIRQPEGFQFIDKFANRRRLQESDPGDLLVMAERGIRDQKLEALPTPIHLVVYSIPADNNRERLNQYRHVRSPHTGIGPENHYGQ